MKKKPLRIMLDMDGVLADFVTGICRAHQRPNPFTDPANHGQFGIENIWKMSPLEFWKPVDRKFFAELPELPDGELLADALLQIKFPFSICTSPPSNDGAVDGKRDWIRKHLGNSAVRQAHFCNEKHAIANPNLILIDDNDKNLRLWRANGGQAILFPRPWNKGHDIDNPLSFVARCLRAKRISGLEHLCE